MTDRKTLSVYDAKATDYAQLTQGDAPDATLQAFINLLPPKGRVLDLGCGPGGSAHHMAKAGMVVDAIDASAEMIKLASAQPGVTAWQATFDELPVGTQYDGVWANFSLLHAARADMPRHLLAIHRALKPDGLLHIALKEGTGEKRDALGRRYTYYTEQTLSALLQQAGFTPGLFQHGQDKGLDGIVAPWLSVTSHA